MASDTYHEPYEALSQHTKDLHRVIVSLMEELEAVDWYQQRAEVCTDDELRAVLIHNKNEEVEHAMMNLEWLRRNSPEFDTNIRTYLLTEGPITEVEKEEKASAAPGATTPTGASGAPARAPAAGAATPPRGASGSLGIGSLKEG